MMFEIGKKINSSKYCHHAINMLKEQFGIDDYTYMNNDYYEVRWHSKCSEPYVLIRNVYGKQGLICKEWYEYYSGQWNFVGRLGRKECVDLYWRYRSESSRRWYGTNIRNDSDFNQTEYFSRRFLNEYFTDYKLFDLH